MAIQAVTVADSISKLVVAGVTICDLDQIPTTPDTRKNGVLFPEPVNWFSSPVITRDSFGGLKSIEYDLNYTYCHSLIGAGRSLFDVYQAAITNITAIYDAVIAASDSTAGAIDITPTSSIKIGPTLSPDGTAYHGCQLVFHVMEFIN